MPPKKEIILGIDPGFGRCGYGVVEATPKGVSFVAAGCIETPRASPQQARLGEIHATLTRIVEKFKPDTLSIEKLFFARNTSTAVGVAESRGIALLVAHEHTLHLREFAPLEVKMALAGYGRATKPQITFMVSRLLGLSQLPQQDDAVDALAIAITAAHTRVIHK